MSPVKKIPFLASLLCVGLLVGCTSKPKPTPSAPVANTPVASLTTTDETSKSFLAVLEAQPSFDARMQYVNAHQGEAHKVGQSKDPAIIRKYSELMTPPQTAPTPPP